MNQSTTDTLTIRIRKGEHEALKKLAESTHRSKTYLAAEAINEYLEANAWQVDEIKQALDESRKADARFIPHGKVEQWARSLGGDKELPKPTA